MSAPQARRLAGAAMVAGAIACSGPPAGGLLAPRDDADASAASFNVAGGAQGTSTLGASPVTCGAGTGPACVASCPDGGTTTVSGRVYDPAGRDPLYGVAVYVPNAPLPSLPSGASCAACETLYPASFVGSAVTGPDGRFTLPDVPSGASVPIVVQTGKWRMQSSISVAACETTVVPDGTLHLPRSAAEGDLPDIAISTGGADSLECLLLRMGVDASEYTPGSTGAGHVHIFSGYAGATTVPPSPSSSASLWDSTTDLAKNDLVLLSCEGQETGGVTTASQQALFDYAALGGRVFASHFHYVWFDLGPFGAYPIARWTSGPQVVVPNDTASAPGDPVTTLPNGQAFPEGVALQQWLGNVGALTAGQLPIWYARHNADVLASIGVSQPWIALDPSVGSGAANATQYLSFDTPIGAASPCGRVVYSDLHVSGGSGADEPGVAPDYPDAGSIGSNTQGGTVPSGCANHPLTPQEKALEFMIFDLSSCLVPIGRTLPVPH